MEGDEQDMSDTLVVIPTYNEAESLPGVLDDITASCPGAHVLVVDDASPDGTGELAAVYDPDRVFVLRREAKDGLARAYVSGFTWGLERGYSYLGQMDADGSHPASALVDMRHADADLAIGSRWTRGGTTQGWSRRRIALSRLGNRYIEAVLGLEVADATAGMRLWRAATLQAIGLGGVHASGFVFQAEMTMAARDIGATIVEVPITFREREAGTSKMSSSIIVESFVSVTRAGIRRRMRASAAPDGTRRVWRRFPHPPRRLSQK